MVEATISSIDPQLALVLLGPRDQHLKAIRDALGVTITHRNSEIRVAGEELRVTQATKALEQLRQVVERNGGLASDDVTRVLTQIFSGESVPAAEPIAVNHLSRAFLPALLANRHTSRPFATMILCLLWARRARARPTWRSQWRWKR